MLAWLLWLLWKRKKKGKLVCARRRTGVTRDKVYAKEKRMLVVGVGRPEEGHAATQPRSHAAT